MGMREAYIEKVTSQLAEWHAWIEQHTAENTPSASHWQVNPTHIAQRLEERFQRACAALSVLHSAPDGAWLSAKNDMENALIDLKIALDESGANQAGQSLALHAGRQHVFMPFSRRV